MIQWLWRKNRTEQQAANQALRDLKAQVEKMNIPVVADDFDAGYDIAVDEVLVLIERALNPETSNDDVTYGDNE